MEIVETTLRSGGAEVQWKLQTFSLRLTELLSHPQARNDFRLEIPTSVQNSNAHSAFSCTLRQTMITPKPLKFADLRAFVRNSSPPPIGLPLAALQACIQPPALPCPCRLHEPWLDCLPCEPGGSCSSSLWQQPVRSDSPNRRFFLGLKRSKVLAITTRAAKPRHSR